MEALQDSRQGMLAVKNDVAHRVFFSQCDADIVFDRIDNYVEFKVQL